MPKNEVSSINQDEQSTIGNFVINHQLLDFLTLQDVSTAIFSNSGSLLEMPLIKSKLEDHFDYIFSAKKLKTSKSLPAGYLLVAKQLKLPPDQIVFIDDRYDNIQAAQQAGMKTIQFFNNAEVFDQIRHLLN